MNGWNAGHGTGSHSALKKAAKPKPYRKEEKVYGGDKTWSEGEAKAKSLGQDLNKLVAQRNKLTKGSPEYNKVQDKINMILGSKKRHAGGEGDEASSSTTTTTMGVEKTKTKSKIDTDGDGTANASDTDDDGDGVLDTADAFPLDPSASSDTDSDGIADGDE